MFFDYFTRYVEAPGFRYRGGKYTLRKQLIRWMPKRGSSFVEPFAGRGNITLLAKLCCEYQKWVLNDKQTADFLRTVRSYNDSPVDIPFVTKEQVEGLEGRLAVLLQPVTRWAGGFDNATPTKIGVHPHRYQQILTRASGILHGVCIINRDAVEVIRKYAKDARAFLYVDPPYLKANVVAYDEGMVDRKAMISALKNAKCRWMFSEYMCDDAVKAFGPPAGKIVTQINPNPNSEIAYQQRVEYFWTNYKPVCRIMNFGTKTKPSVLSVRMFRMLAPVTHMEWMKLDGPPNKLEQQFSALCNLRDAYYDGETLYRVDRDTGQLITRRS